MLFLLKSCADSKVYYLLNNKYVVGRKNCHILIENDQSISRLHAIIQVKKDTVTITDAGSRYSTFRDGQELRPHIEYPLKHGNKVQFGLFGSKFIFEQHSFITAVSRLTTTEKSQLKKDLSSIGGQLAEYWDNNCTHLTVKEVGMTMKVLYAVSNNAPIVTLQYWNEASKKVAAGEQLPDVNMFSSPPVAQSISNRVQWKKNVDRKGLFKNKMFIFITEGAKKPMERIILQLGGSCVACDREPPIPVKKLKEFKQQVVVIQPLVRKSENRTFDEITSFIAEKKQRLILELEIALAILSGSCDKYCNPDFKKTSEIFLNIGDCALDTSQMAHKAAVAGTMGLQESDHQHQLLKKRSTDEHDGYVVKRFKSKMIPSSSTLGFEVVQKYKNDNNERHKSINVYSDGVLNLVKPSGERIAMKSINVNIPPHKRRTEKNHSLFAKELGNINPLSSIVFAGGAAGVETLKSKSMNNEQKQNLDSSIDCDCINVGASGTDGTDASLISKKSNSEVITIDVEDSSECETNFAEVIERFKNAFDIVPMKIPLENNAGDNERTADGKINFKKFKKVKPICPQSKTIDNMRLVNVSLRRRCSIRAEELRLSQSQKEQVAASQFDSDVVPVKRGPKRFILTQELSI